MSPGTLAGQDALRLLDTGIYISDLWYLNFSDPQVCRMTGMTRFASFWVEDGQLVAPLSVMRFDDSIYEILGSKLVGLTRKQRLSMKHIPMVRGVPLRCKPQELLWMGLRLHFNETVKYESHPQYANRKTHLPAVAACMPPARQSR